ncbi:MAG: thymidine kinase [Candidatus Hodarchaeota archaeon]
MTSIFNPYTLELIIGNMYSGKSKKLIKRAVIAKQQNIPTLVFKPSLDKRSTDLMSKAGMSIKCTTLKNPKDIFNNIQNSSLILIDEVQFFDESIVYIIQYLVDRGSNVVVAGLDRDFRGQPFYVTSFLMVLADKITKLYSKCSIEGCHNKGTRTQRFRDGKPDSLLSETFEIEFIAEKIEYMPVCKEHHKIPDFKEFIEEKIRMKLK